MWLGALSCVGVGPSGWVAFVEWRGRADFGLIGGSLRFSVKCGV